MTETPERLSDLLDELIDFAQESARTGGAKWTSAVTEIRAQILARYTERTQYSLDGDFLAVEMAKIGIRGSALIGQAAGIVLRALSPEPPMIARYDRPGDVDGVWVSREYVNEAIACFITPEYQKILADRAARAPSSPHE